LVGGSENCSLMGGKTGPSFSSRTIGLACESFARRVRQYQNNIRDTTARKTIPPTTPPAMAPAFECWELESELIDPDPVAKVDVLGVEAAEVTDEMELILDVKLGPEVLFAIN